MNILNQVNCEFSSKIVRIYSCPSNHIWSRKNLEKYHYQKLHLWRCRKFHSTIVHLSYRTNFFFFGVLKIIVTLQHKLLKNYCPWYDVRFQVSNQLSRAWRNKLNIWWIWFILFKQNLFNWIKLFLYCMLPNNMSPY